MTINRIALIGATLAFAIAIGIGLYLAGSPAEQRLVRFDQQRISDLMQIRTSIDGYWRTHRSLPSRASEDVIGIPMDRVPRDPKSDAAYEYEVISDDAYRLCAVFSRPSADRLVDDFWAHEPGRHCFEFRVTEQ